MPAETTSTAPVTDSNSNDTEASKATLALAGDEMATAAVPDEPDPPHNEPIDT